MQAKKNSARQRIAGTDEATDDERHGMAAFNQIEITAVFLGERFRFSNADGDTIIADAKIVDGPRPEGVNGHASIKVAVGDGGELDWKSTYRFFGRWSDYTNKRTGETTPQFHATSFTESVPLEESGVIAYLVRHGEGCGIGQERAKRLFAEHGPDAIRFCRESPVGVCSTFGNAISLEQSERLAARLQKNAHAEACSIELVQLLARRGFPKDTAHNAMELWGTAAPQVIRRDPYKLMTSGLRGCGFKRCDQMYLSLGLPPGRLKRQALCAWYAVAKAGEASGDTWTAASVAVTAIRRSVAGAEPKIAEALRLAIRSGYLTTIRTDGLRGPFVDQGGHLWLAESRKATNERYIARHLAAAANEQLDWPEIPSVGISDHQQEKLRDALRGVISILIGSPGTGKTFSAAAIIQAIIAEHGDGSIAACAPTGKAAVRLTESLNDYGIPLRARTIHSTLGVRKVKGAGWSFMHNESHPLPFRWLIVDEPSMIDANLFSSLLAARAVGTHVLLLGDVNQLLPVGHGAPLRDLVATGMPYGELTEVRRNSGMIVEACAAMRDGRMPEVVRDRLAPNNPERNLSHFQCNEPRQQIELLKATLDSLAQSGFNRIWDIQVLAAVNKKSPLSRRDLNKLLQAELNPSPAIEGSPFRLADKIVNTKNGYFNDASGERDPDTGDFAEHYVANGEIGRVVAVEPKSIIVSLDTPERMIRVPRGKWTDKDADRDSATDGDGSDSAVDENAADGDTDNDRGPQTGCTFDLAYALSTHKSQGSEFPVVIVMLDDWPGAKRVCDRAWLYTAVSRAKKLCVLIGQEATARRMVRVNRIMERKTFLAELYKRNRMADVLKELF